MFDQRSQIDILTVLLLLGESVMWKAIWGRLRSKRKSWRHWLFAVSPGWAPLAATIFTAFNGSGSAPNLIYDRPPPEAVDSGLILTHLSSGASHSASNVMLQNIWHTWKKGPRRAYQDLNQNGGYYISKDTGLVDVEISEIPLYNDFGLMMQTIGLALQLLLAVLVGALGCGYESLTALAVALIGQTLLIAAISPLREGWTPHLIEAEQPCPVMLHKGLDSTSILIIRSASRHGVHVTLEQFCYERLAVDGAGDRIKITYAGLSFVTFVLDILLVDWMTTNSKLLFFVIGFIGLAATAVEGASTPNWSYAFNRSFEGEAICSPVRSSLMAAVGVLAAARYPASKDAARLLYPNNRRFNAVLDDLTDIFDTILCNNCRQKLHTMDTSRHNWQCRNDCQSQRRSCAELLADHIQNPSDSLSRQHKDGIAAVYHCLRRFSPVANLPRVTTQINTRVHLQPHMQHNWS